MAWTRFEEGKELFAYLGSFVNEEGEGAVYFLGTFVNEEREEGFTLLGTFVNGGAGVEQLLRLNFIALVAAGL